MLNSKALPMANILQRLLNAAFAQKNSLPCLGRWRRVYSAKSEQHGKSICDQRISQWMAVSGFTALILGFVPNHVEAEQVSGNSSDINYTETISNAHTAKWRVYTNKGKDLFSEGKLDDAEQYLLLALEEAKEGFGDLDPHVASALNNLAELYRMQKKFDKAEPLYMEAIRQLEVLLGPEDLRVGFALHNLGGFLQMQNKLEQAQSCYERAMKIKRRVLGLNHPDYANTMFHFGEVLHLQGRIEDAEVLIRDSIRILEESKLGQSQLMIKRMGYLAWLLLDSKKFHDAENVQRKILHILEITKGWDSLSTVNAAEQLAMTLQTLGYLSEAVELLKRCLQGRESNEQANHIQNGTTMVKLAKAMISKASQSPETSDAKRELADARLLLNDAIRVAEANMYVLQKPERNNEAVTVLMTMMESFDAIGMLEKWRDSKAMQNSGSDASKAEVALRNCISVVKKPEIPEWILESEPIKKQYLSCQQHLVHLLSQTATRSNNSVKQELGELNKEIKQIESTLGRRLTA